MKLLNWYRQPIALTLWLSVPLLALLTLSPWGSQSRGSDESLGWVAELPNGSEDSGSGELEEETVAELTDWSDTAAAKGVAQPAKKTNAAPPPKNAKNPAPTPAKKPTPAAKKKSDKSDKSDKSEKSEKSPSKPKSDKQKGGGRR